MKTRSNENNKNSAAKKIIPAVGMLALSATMLSTSTYAWFTMNKEVEMTGLSMTATVGEGMEIALAEVNGTAITTPSLTTPGDDRSESWGSAVAVGEYYEKIGLLSPASSVDGKNLFDAQKVSNGGRKAGKYVSLTLPDSMTPITPKSELVAGSKIKSDSTQKGFYVDVTVHLRTNKKATATDANENVYCKLVIKNNKNTSDEYSDDTLDATELYKAVRVAFIPSANDTSSTTNIFGVDDNYLTAGKAVKQAGDAATALDTVTVVMTDAVTNDSFDKVSGVDSGLDIPLATTGNNYGHLDFTVRVWLEGESASCINDNAGQSWNIDLAFSLGEFDTATTSEGVGA